MSGGLVAYAWDPSDDQDDGNEEDSLHALESVDKPISLLNPRSVSNIGVLILLVGCLLGLFIALPVVTYIQNSSHSIFINETGGNTINAPQGALHVSSLVGPGTPHSAKTRIALMVKPHHKGTATWFFEGRMHKEWKSAGSESLFWIHGKRAPLSHSATRRHLIAILICSWLRQEYTLLWFIGQLLLLSKTTESLVVFQFRNHPRYRSHV
jgi:hypothetical protein